jgi:hypothetical protein
VPRAQRLLRIVELAAAVVLLGAPAILPPSAWRLTVAHRWLGLSLLSVVAIRFAWRRRGGDSAAAVGSGEARLGAGDVLLLVAMPVYVLALGSGRQHTSGDNAATRLLGPLIVRQRTIDLSCLPEYQSEPLHYSATRVGDRVLPAYPLGTGLLSVPYAALALGATGGDWNARSINRWEKHFSALLTAAATALLFLGMRRLAPEWAALGAAFVFAFASPVFSSMSQGMWSTTGELFLLCLALWLVVPEPAGKLRLLAAGVAVGASFGCRPTAAVAALVLALVLLARRKTDFAWYASSAVTSIAAVCLAQLHLYGHAVGGYGRMETVTWGHTALEGLLGTLVSPSRGLLPFCPYVLLIPPAWRRLRPEGALRLWLLGGVLAVAAYYLLAGVFDLWTGGMSIGPRYMSEAAPFIAILTLPAWLGLRERNLWAAPFVLALAFAAATQVLSVYTDRAERANLTLTDSAAFFSLRHSQLAAIWCLPCPGEATGRGDEPR